MGRWSSIAILDKKVEELETLAAKEGVIISLKKEIPYGTQLLCEGSSESGVVTLYHSKKKGFSAVNNGNNGATDTVCSLFKGEPLTKSKRFSVDTDSSGFYQRIGSDEAGKGDFFGPLVTAAFFIETPEMEEWLTQLGIRDSKKLNDTKISSMATKIWAKYPKHIEVISPAVEKYNNLYSTIGNLNRLLGWMHGRVIANLSERFYRDKKILAVVDKFADKSNVTKSVAGLERVNIEAVTHGEDAELAVAVASVIARDRFVYLMDKMSKEFDMRIPKGANSIVKKVGREFITKFGRERLGEVVKLHFKTSKEL